MSNAIPNQILLRMFFFTKTSSYSACSSRLVITSKVELFLVYLKLLLTFTTVSMYIKEEEFIIIHHTLFKKVKVYVCAVILKLYLNLSRT